jgi:hypothetical protein
MRLRSLWIGTSVALALELLVPPVLAQSPPQAIQGYDSGTGKPCVVGQTPTCSLQISGGGSAGVVITQTQAAPTTDGSASITTGGTFQQVLPANTSRKTLEMQNICSVAAGGCVATSDNCYWTTVATASATKANSFLLAPGAYYGRLNGVVPSDAISVTCDGTGDKFKFASQ